MFTVLLFLIPFSIPFINFGGFSFFTNNAAQTANPVASNSSMIYPKISCFPRPWCLDHQPYCNKYLKEPVSGWCPPSASEMPGCYFIHKPCLMIACQEGQPCPTCSPDLIKVCPSVTPRPYKEIHPQLTCLMCAKSHNDKLCFSSTQQKAYCKNATSTSPDPSDVVCVTCTNVNPTPLLTPPCHPRPACLDAIPACVPPEPNGGWCSQINNGDHTFPEVSGVSVTGIQVFPGVINTNRNHE